MAQVLLAAIVGLMAGGIGMTFYVGSELKQFLSRVPQLRSQEDLDEYRRMAGRQMYAALIQIVVLGTPFILFMYGVFKGYFNCIHVLLYLALNGALFMVSMMIKQIELQVRQLPAANEAIAAERDRIVHIWRTKALPNWKTDRGA